MPSLLYWVEAIAVGSALGVWLDAPWYGYAALIFAAYWFTMMSAAAWRFVVICNVLVAVGKGVHANKP